MNEFERAGADSKVPEWVKKFELHIHTLSQEEIQRLERWFSEADATTAVRVLSDARFLLTHEIAAKQLSVETLREIENFYPQENWTPSFFTGLLSNPNIRKVPFIWKRVKEGIPAESSVLVLEWVELSEGREFIDSIIDQRENPIFNLYGVIKRRPEAIVLLTDEEIKSFLTSEHKVHRAAAIFALGEIEKQETRFRFDSQDSAAPRMR